MSKRPALIQQSDATRLLKAARAAGYSRATLTSHPDGRVEIVAEDAEAPAASGEISPFAKWKAGHAR